MHQQRRSFEENDSRVNRRILDVEGEVKELSRRIDRTGRSEGWLNTYNTLLILLSVEKSYFLI